MAAYAVEALKHGFDEDQYTYALKSNWSKNEIYLRLSSTEKESLL